MQIFVALATFAYLAVMFALVGTVVGFFFGFVGVLWFGVEFAHLPLFGAGGAVGFALWAFPRACSGDAGAREVVETTPREGNWMAENDVEQSPMAFDPTPGLFDAVTFVESSSALGHLDQPRPMIDAFTFGDNLYEAIYET
jgi:hypothetical protein